MSGKDRKVEILKSLWTCRNWILSSVKLLWTNREHYLVPLGIPHAFCGPNPCPSWVCELWSLFICSFLLHWGYSQEKCIVELCSAEKQIGSICLSLFVKGNGGNYINNLPENPRLSFELSVGNSGLKVWTWTKPVVIFWCHLAMVYLSYVGFMIFFLNLVRYLIWFFKLWAGTNQIKNKWISAFLVSCRLPYSVSKILKDF